MIADGSTFRQLPTRERLLAAGLSLFARQGFEATSVGEIEAAAGLQPRRGALYRHFPSKEALLETAIERHFEAVKQVEFDMLKAEPLAPREAALVFGRWLLADMDAQRAMTHILEREGERLAGLRDRFRAGSDAGFKATALLFARWADHARIHIDAEAAATVVMGGIVNYRRSTWTLGRAPLDLDDERFLEGLATLLETLFRSNRRAGDKEASRL